MDTVVACPHCQQSNRVRPEARGVPHCGACGQPLPWVVAATADSLGEELRASVPVLVDLWAPWCGPCRGMGPAVERLARDRAGALKVVTLNVDEAPEVAANLGAQSIPLLVLARDGQEVARLTGAVLPRDLGGWLDSQLAALRPKPAPAPGSAR